MIKWKTRAIRIGFILGAIAAFAVSAGAGQRWY
jgi:hypothetical protein